MERPDIHECMSNGRLDLFKSGRIWKGWSNLPRQ